MGLFFAELMLKEANVSLLDPNRVTWHTADAWS